MSARNLVWVAPLLLILCIGCQALPPSGGGSSSPADQDEDGLSDAEEAILGTNPEIPDTDGDSLGDGEERELGTSPLAADSDGDRLRDDIDPDPLVAEANDNAADNDNGAGNENANANLNNNTA